MLRYVFLFIYVELTFQQYRNYFVSVIIVVDYRWVQIFVVSDIYPFSGSLPLLVVSFLTHFLYLLS